MASLWTCQWCGGLNLPASDCLWCYGLRKQAESACQVLARMFRTGQTEGEMWHE